MNYNLKLNRYALLLFFFCITALLNTKITFAEDSKSGFLKIMFPEKTFSNLSIIDAESNKIVRKNVFTWQKQELAPGTYIIKLEIGGFKITKEDITINSNQTTNVPIDNFGFIKIKTSNDQYHRYDIYEKESNKLIKRDVISINKQIVPTGIYNISFNIGGNRMKREDILVKANETTEIELSNISHVLVKTSDKIFHKYSLIDPKTNKISRANLWTNYKHQVIAGTYDIEADVNGIITTLKNVTITPDSPTTVELKGLGMLKIDFIGAKHIRYDIQEERTKRIIKRNVLIKDRISLPENIYNLIFNVNGIYITRKDIAIAPNEVATVTIDTLGMLQINTSSAKQLRYNIYRPGKNKPLRRNVSIKEPSWLPEGKYKITIKTGSEIKNFNNVHIKPNETTELTV